MDILLPSLELGLLYAVVVFGIFLTFRVLNFPDLTVDGSFVTGAAVTAIAIKSGVPGMQAIFFGFAAGALAGLLTAFLHTGLGIGKILSGILSLSMLYTINLRLMGGANISLIKETKIINFFQIPINHFYVVLFLLLIVFSIKFFLDWLLQTELGLWLRATGDNELTAQSLSINTKLSKHLGIGLSNGLVGLAGGIIAQFQGFADINMGVGTVIIGLAALMIGESLITKDSISLLTLVIMIGAIIYQIIINIALNLGLSGTDIKFITSLIVVISLALGNNNKLKMYGKKLFNN